MLGAIIGDIVGSNYEFANHRSKRFDLFTKEKFFTDDTVCTCAIAYAVSMWSKNKQLDLSHLATMSLRLVCRDYPGAGYGFSFRRWLYAPNAEPYNSFGNGSAMRVSSIGWIANSKQEVKDLSYAVTAITHNHPEGIKGAEATAMLIYMARNGATMPQLLHEARKYYPDVWMFNYDDLKKNYYFNEFCQSTVPQAIYCFLISKSFEDCLRIAISIGGDSDTLAAIACSIAEAYYGIPNRIKQGALKYFNKSDKGYLLAPIKEIYEKVGKHDYIKI